MHHVQYCEKYNVPPHTKEADSDDLCCTLLVFFGTLGVLNYIAYLEASTVDLMMGTKPFRRAAEFFVNGKTKNKPYLLADQIYSEWAYI